MVSLRHHRRLLAGVDEWPGSRRLARQLFSIVHLLLERLRFLFIGKDQAGKTALDVEGVEECAVLVEGEGLVQFLVPDDAVVGGLKQGQSTVNEEKRNVKTLTEMSTSLSQRVWPTVSSQSTMAPWRPV